jgi:ABC-type uncharacterized transport system substrate-binding protein
MEAKRLGSLHEFVPNAAEIGVLLSASNPFFNNQLGELNKASCELGLKIQIESATNEDDIARSFATNR